MPSGIQFKGERGAVLLAGTVIVLAGIAAYAGSFSGPMLYDDIPSIAANPAVHHLWPLWDVLAGPGNSAVTTSGRPVLALSFAANHALSGNRVWSYHAVNLLIHLGAGLALFGIVRRTLRWSALTPMRFSAGNAAQRIEVGPSPRLRPAGNALHPLLIAFAVALLWTVHPLQTEAVTYIVQRAESLMGLFYLLTLYCFIRGAERDERGRSSFAPSSGASVSVEATPEDEKAARHAALFWFGLSCLACLFGMATKEVMATAPLMVLFYDRTFLAGTFREAWRRRWGIYVALAATWLPLAYLVASGGGNRGGSVGFGLPVAWWAYGLTQFQAVARYLWLSLWPHPLVFEYGLFWVEGAGEVIPYAVPVLLLLGATIWLLVRPSSVGSSARGLGFLGAWFFGILAPSSLMPGTTQMIVEHRMYLSLAAVMTALVLGIYDVAAKISDKVGPGDCARPLAPSFPEVKLERAVGRDRPTLPPEQGAMAYWPLFFCIALAAGFGALTIHRNQTYRSELALWGDTLAKRPNNVVAHFNYGDALCRAGRIPEGMEHFQRAVQLRPDLAVTHLNYASQLVKMGGMTAAVPEFEAALRINPDSVEAHVGLGIALAALGRPTDAIAHYQTALELRPNFASAHDNFGNALLQMDRLPEAADHYAEAVRLDPEDARAQANLGNVLLQLGRTPEAMPHLTEAVRLAPDLAEAHAKLGDGWMESSRPADAIVEYEAALQLQPDYVQAQNNLGIALAATGRLPEAVSHYREALRLDPGLVDAHFDLANTLFRLGRPAEAAAEYEAVLKLKPDDQQARARLAIARQAAARGNPP
jgi:protein O-mannosyl-transferase